MQILYLQIRNSTSCFDDFDNDKNYLSRDGYQTIKSIIYVRSDRYNVRDISPVMSMELQKNFNQIVHATKCSLH